MGSHGESPHEGFQAVHQATHAVRFRAWTTSLEFREVNVLIFLDFSFRYDSVHQKY